MLYSQLLGATRVIKKNYQFIILTLINMGSLQVSHKRKPKQSIHQSLNIVFTYAEIHYFGNTGFSIKDAWLILKNSPNLLSDDIREKNTVCLGKIVFFHNSLQPLPRLHRYKRPLKLSKHCECKSLLLAGIFLYNQQQPSAGEEEVANFREFLEKNTIFNEHPVVYLQSIIRHSVCA